MLLRYRGEFKLPLMFGSWALRTVPVACCSHKGARRLRGQRRCCLVLAGWTDGSVRSKERLRKRTAVEGYCVSAVIFPCAPGGIFSAMLQKSRQQFNKKNANKVTSPLQDCRMPSEKAMSSLVRSISSATCAFILK